jgi:glycogen operon protein
MLLNAPRRLRDAEPERQRVSLDRLLRQATVTWHGVKLGQPDWGESSHSLALEAEPEREDFRVYLILNAYWGALEFELPPAGEGGPWRRWIDTSLEAPQDIVSPEIAPPLDDPAYVAAARSVVVLFVDIEQGETPR